MRKIKLEAALEFGSRADFAIVDVTEKGKANKRGTITIDYAPSDLNQFKEQEMSFEQIMDYYHDRIYGLVKYYISGDWEDAGGYDEAMEIIRNHVRMGYE